MQNEKSLSLRSPELLPTKDSERNLSLWIIQYFGQA